MKIHNKLFLVFFSFSLLLVTALMLLIQWSIGKGLTEYVNSKELAALQPLMVELEREYEQKGSWKGMQGEHKKLGDLLIMNLANIDGEIESAALMKRPPPEFGHPPPSINDFPRPRQKPGFALFDHQDNLVAGHYLKRAEYNKAILKVNDQAVGWLMIPQRNKITDGFELDFIQQQKSYLWIIALVTMGLVVLITFPLARHLAEPIKKIIFGMHQLTQGNYLQHIDVNRKDELGELSRDFNELALTLHENEDARKRWLANISHELRTPVSILRGELEAMLDGVRPLNENNIGSANDEVKHLQSLIDDLHQLTSADIGGMHYRKSNIDLCQWLASEENKFSSYLSAVGTSLQVDIEAPIAVVFADRTRLCQLFENLINNCIKYAEASAVKISLTVQQQASPHLVQVIVEDNGVGVPEQHLSHLFEYLYRVEDSRNRKTGGSGLGLSICAHIVTAHQGHIRAQASEMGGLAIIIELPLSQ